MLSHFGNHEVQPTGRPRSTGHVKLHFDLSFFLPQYQRQRKCFFFRARAEKGASRQIHASSVVWTLIDNGKLANQIARLAAIVVKNCFHVAFVKYIIMTRPQALFSWKTDKK